jgi:hypothetical protein
MANPVIVLTNQTALSYTSNPVKGDGYYGFADGLQTMSFHFSNFTGRLYVEATLLEAPTESDWFMIGLDIDTEYLELAGSTSTVGTSFQGNFVYLRVRIDRDYLGDSEYNVTQHGILDKAVLLI